MRPLRVDELAEIFAIEFDADVTYNLVEDWRPENAQEAVLSACTTLISIIGDDEDGKIVQFSHFSVKEFLTSDRFRVSDIGNNFHYYIPLDDAHTILARACLTVLLQLDETTDKNRLTKFPLASYSAWYWADHAKFGDVASRIQDAMERLFYPKRLYFGSWIWIRSLGGKRNQAMDRLAERPSQPEETPLYYAAYYGFIGLTKQLIVAHGEDVNTKCGRRGSPLHAASRKGHIDVVRLLLDHGADVNLRGGHGTTALRRAYMGRHFEVMRLLLEHGADVEKLDIDAFGTLVHNASFRGQVEVVHLLLQHNADVNARADISTPLHLASRSGRTRVVQLLLEHGADVHAKDKSSRTSLDWAITKQYHDIVQILLEHGAKTTDEGPQ
jgi:hypothetical protein